ncbi:hypothetical protein [Haladaptatus salinisoli]|uniref:hypothetical protein n=1 Tax=Haladaptatus salinisoli TaxID=2884876 RepID=UPI001D0A7128|nr:hypothetical protein [Haladaptatus salinisoli]
MTTHRSTKIVLAALEVATEEGTFRLPDLEDCLNIPENPPSNSILRQVLNQLKESGWLERDQPEGQIWYAGNQSDEFTK